jgi:hypothetical protein
MSKKIANQFSPDDKKHLSYLGSKLHRAPTEIEAMQNEILDDLELGRKQGWKGLGPKAQDQQTQAEEAS